jgi:hypothetical protein
MHGPYGDITEEELFFQESDACYNAQGELVDLSDAFDGYLREPVEEVEFGHVSEAVESVEDRKVESDEEQNVENIEEVSVSGSVTQDLVSSDRAVDSGKEDVEKVCEVSHALDVVESIEERKVGSDEEQKVEDVEKCGVSGSVIQDSGSSGCIVDSGGRDVEKEFGYGAVSVCALQDSSGCQDDGFLSRYCCFNTDEVGLERILAGVSALKVLKVAGEFVGAKMDGWCWLNLMGDAFAEEYIATYGKEKGLPPELDAVHYGNLMKQHVACFRQSVYIRVWFDKIHITTEPYLGAYRVHGKAFLYALSLVDFRKKFDVYWVLEHVHSINHAWHFRRKRGVHVLATRIRDKFAETSIGFENDDMLVLHFFEGTVGMPGELGGSVWKSKL